MAEELESEVWGAIGAFEQILEAMPNDKASLEALAHAYEHIGDQVRAKEYMIRLLDVFLDEGNVAGCPEHADKLRANFPDDPSVAAVIMRYDSMATTAAPVDKVPVAPIETPVASPEVDYRSSFDISEELAFAWNLLGANELTQDEYSSVVEDLTEMSAKEGVTISMLHVLYDRGFRNLERVLGMASKECSTPLMSLEQFDLQNETLGILPLDFMVRRGCILFELVGGEGLVTVLNPYDKKLREDIERLAGRKCYYFLIHPGSFDDGMLKVREALNR